MDVLSLGKSIRRYQYFGHPIAGRSDEERTSADLEDYVKMLTTRIEDLSYDGCYGGTVSSYLRDHSYDPQLVLGATMTPGPTDVWNAFIVSADSIADLELRKHTIRRWIHNVLYNFSDGYWLNVMRNVGGADAEDGQAILRLWSGHFLEDEIVNVAARADALLKMRIKGTENPTTKLEQLMAGWRALQCTQHHASYNVQWFCGAVSHLINANAHYSVFRQAGGTAAILNSTSVSAAAQIVRKCWTDNHIEWEKIENKKYQSHSSRMSAPGRYGAGGGGGGRGNASQRAEIDG
jgi:hypothetical protein